MSAKPMSRFMPENAGTSRGPVTSPAVVLGERKGPQGARPVEETTKHDADLEVAPWLGAAVKMWGKATAYAESIEVDLQYLNKMLAGTKSIPLRALLPLLGHVEAVLAFTAPLLESIGYVARPVNAPTFTQLAGAVLADLDDGSAITRALIERAAEKRGWTAAQVELALHREGETK